MPDLLLLRIYLDSNVLFSASLNERSDFLDFWRLRGVRPATSRYAVGEVSRNILFPSQRVRFEKLLLQTEVVSDADIRVIPSHTTLVAKDRPILAAAIGASVDYLVTGDKNHFSHLYNTTVCGVKILSPTDFFALYKSRLVT